MYDERFKKVVECVFGIEKEYVNDPKDAGGPTNFGITQTTYDSWNKRHNKPFKDVKNISKEEATEIYYYDYWIASGANDVKDIRLAYCLFDMSVNSGEGAAKQAFKKCNGDFNKFIENRKKYYYWCVKNRPADASHLEGWMNRLKDLERNANKLVEDIKTEIGNIPTDYTPDIISKMTPKKYERNREKIEKELQTRQEKLKKLRDNGIKAAPTTSNKKSMVNPDGIEINNKKLADLPEKDQAEFWEGFDKNEIGNPKDYPFEGTKTASKKEDNWTKDFNIGNPNTDDGHWITIKNGKHLFIKDKVG